MGSSCQALFCKGDHTTEALSPNYLGNGMRRTYFKCYHCSPLNGRRQRMGLMSSTGDVLYGGGICFHPCIVW